MKGWWWSGIAEKSGHTSQLKMCECRMRMVSGVACTCTGAWRSSPTESIISGSAAMWSRCAWVRKTWSIRANSSSVRSPTPVPQSISMSSSSRNEVVRGCAPPIPPLHPSTLSFMASVIRVRGSRRPPCEPMRNISIARPVAAREKVTPVPPAQARRKNSILTPAISMMSWSRRGRACASIALPLTSGKLAPSTWVMK